ncbi:MAG: type I 3-dehydroquinate dehydratase [Spirochaetaceae bacterium]|jgi:3-dehydroquinate dehydratase/shikimate dehydrogenase|nr:type I 3-dehydroquinate dehydratase [Spirochaetaceae bacterium]
MAKICLCLTGKTIKRDLELLEKYRREVDMVELRADCLEPDERLLIRRFPEQAGIPVILTIRRDADGGFFTGGEASRMSLLSKGLAFADANPRHNFAYVDVEEYFNVPSLEEAARAFGTRVIRSYHNRHGVDADLAGRIRSLCRVGDELVKVAVTPRTTEDVLRIFKAGWETMDMEKILIGMGCMGVPTRILAEQMGSQISYTSVKGEPDLPDIDGGQLEPRELAELYRFRNITAKTRVFGIAGYPLKVTFSPLFFNTVFGLENIDAVYVPFPTDALEPFMELADRLGLGGASVTIPHKEAVLPYLARSTEGVKSIGACNTIVYGEEGWSGYNADAPGFSGSLLDFIGKKNFKGKRVTIVGAGGVARAVASEIYRLHGKALVLNRTSPRAKEVAAPYRFAWGALDSQGVREIDKYRDIIIQTTPAGMEGHAEEDPLECYSFSGFEVVMDLIYKPERTFFLRRAEAAGCRVLNGYDMLMRQAQLQYGYFINAEFPAHLMARMRF